MQNLILMCSASLAMRMLETWTNKITLSKPNALSSLKTRAFVIIFFSKYLLWYKLSNTHLSTLPTFDFLVFICFLI